MQSNATNSPVKRSRIPVVGPTVRSLSRPENRVLEFMGAVAIVGSLLVLFASVVAPGPGTIWLSAVGGAVLGVGVSVFCSIIATRQSTIESYRRDANLQRKDELYGPLFTEFKRLHDLLREARDGQAPYPQWIDIPGQQHPARQGFIPGYQCPTLSLWPQFKADHRVDQFTLNARERFDVTLDIARDYNRAAIDVRAPVREILEQKLQQAIADVEQNPAYQRWYTDEKERNSQTFPSQLSAQPRPTDYQQQVFVAIAYGLSFASPKYPLHGAWAAGWLEAVNVHQPVTLGWLLANRPDRAARFLYEAFISTNVGAAVPQEWCHEVLVAVCAEMSSFEAYAAFLVRARSLESAIGGDLNRLSDALSYIQERFEGGTPPV